MISNILLSCDLLGPEPKLNIFSRTRYKTKLGGSLSILSYLAILGIVCFMILQTIQRRSLSIVYNEEINKAPYFNFSESPFFIGVQSGITEEFGPKPQIYSISAEYIKYHALSSDQDNIKLNLDECWKIFDYGPPNETYYQRAIFHQNYSLWHENNVELYGADGIFANFSTIVFRLNQCVNTTNKHDCAPKKSLTIT